MQKAEILRLRLGLAKYKVKTGQSDVPLEQLEAQAHSRQVGPESLRDRILQFSRNIERTAAAVRATATRRPLPEAPSARREFSSSATDWADAEEDEVTRYDTQEEDALPKLPPPRRNAEPPTTPRRKRPENEEPHMSSSALQNGAASRLLSLSRS